MNHTCCTGMNTMANRIREKIRSLYFWCVCWPNPSGRGRAQSFGALFFFITGFHGFHVFSGVLFLTIIMINAMSGLYAARRNGYEMVEKIGLYWHFVDLVWVFVFLVFYLL
jgi:heme/copper-type cytochrome/quinol oxidase subunit 3